MQKEQADLVCQQVEQKPLPKLSNEDIQPPRPSPHLSPSSQVSHSGIISNIIEYL